MFTTQVKVRVHVDQIGELIEQTSEMIPNSSNTLNGFQLTTALNNSWTEIYRYWVFFPILVLRCFTALITCSSRNRLCVIHPGTDGLHFRRQQSHEIFTHVAWRLRLCDGARIAWRCGGGRRSWVTLSTWVNDLLLDPPWKTLIQLIELITRHLSLAKKFQGLRLSQQAQGRHLNTIRDMIGKSETREKHQTYIST